MGLFRNADVATRVWPSLSAPDGSTLRLGPGETAEVDVPDGFADAWLRPVPAPKAPAPASVAKTTEPAAAAVDPKE